MCCTVDMAWHDPVGPLPCCHCSPLSCCIYPLLVGYRPTRYKHRRINLTFLFGKKVRGRTLTRVAACRGAPRAHAYSGCGATPALRTNGDSSKRFSPAATHPAGSTGITTRQQAHPAAPCTLHRPQGDACTPGSPCCTVSCTGHRATCAHRAHPERRNVRVVDGCRPGRCSGHEEGSV